MNGDDLDRLISLIHSFIRNGDNNLITTHIMVFGSDEGHPSTTSTISTKQSNEIKGETVPGIGVSTG